MVYERTRILITYIYSMKKYDKVILNFNILRYIHSYSIGFTYFQNFFNNEIIEIQIYHNLFCYIGH